MTSRDCLFCKIIGGEIKSQPVCETSGILAINDVNPVAEVHILIIPRRHIESVLTVGKSDSRDIIEMFEVAQKIVKDKKLAAFRLAFNGGAYQHVSHLHMHLLSGKAVKWDKL